VHPDNAAAAVVGLWLPKTGLAVAIFQQQQQQQQRQVSES